MLKRKMNFTLLVISNQKHVLKNAHISTYSQHFSTLSQHFDTFCGKKVKIQPFSSCFEEISHKILTFCRTFEYFRLENGAKTKQKQ